MVRNKVKFHYDVQNFVMENGSLADKMRMINSGYDIDDKVVNEILSELNGILNADGGVPFEMVDGNPSSVKETAELLQLLAEFNDTQTEPINRMVEFLVSRQKGDGGFAETLNLEPFIEDRWANDREWYPVGKSVTWLTAKALEALSKVGYDNTERMRRGRDFLLYSQNEDGHWPDFKGHDKSDPLATGNILMALRALGINSDNKVFTDARAALFQHLKSSIENNMPCDMVDIHAVGKAKTDLEKETIKKAIDLVLESQEKDGGWKLMGSKKSDPELSSLLVYAIEDCCK